MAINANNVPGGGKKFDPIEAGVYKARLVSILDLGLQPQGEWQGKQKDPAYELNLTYELSDEFLKDEDGNDMEDKPRWVSETIPLRNIKADKAKSTQRYNALDPTNEFNGDWTQLIGTPCNVTIILNENKGKVYENVAGLATMRSKDADNLPELVNPSRVFDLDEPDLEVFNGLPEWLQKKIKGNLEFAGSPLAHLLGDAVSDKVESAESQKVSEEDLDDEVPF